MLRILVIDNEETDLLACYIFARQADCKVTIIDTPFACELADSDIERCTRTVGCADAILLGQNLPALTGLELLRRQKEGGCKIGMKSKGVMATSLTEEEKREYQRIGCHFLQKPLTFAAFEGWLKDIGIAPA